MQPVVTGSWGCVASADVQLRAIIQWAAASYAGIPRLVFYTFGDDRLSQASSIRDLLKIK